MASTVTSVAPATLPSYCAVVRPPDSASGSATPTATSPPEAASEVALARLFESAVNRT